MTEENKFKEVDSIQLYDDNIGYVKLYDASHANESEEQRQYTVANIASLAYGSNESKNPAALYERLKVLHHESCFEFVRDGYGSCGINSSLRMQPNPYKDNYSHDAERHKQNIACFRIKVPIFVARQFMRHRSFSYLEMSRRYTKGSKVPFEFWFPNCMSEEHKAVHISSFEADMDAVIEMYNLETQVASRFLPQTTYTEFYCMGHSDGLKNYFNLRCDSHAQKEIQDLSFSMLQLLYKHQPELYINVVPNDEVDKTIRKA
jgi:hypothetical protein